MKNIFNLALLFVLFTISTSCQREMMPKDLFGNWEAITIYEEGQPLEIDYPIIRLQVSENGTYGYTGTLNYKEAGLWRIENDYFITKDTLLSSSLEKTVFISNLTQDSFEMKMKEGKKERVLVMVKS